MKKIIFLFSLLFSGVILMAQGTDQEYDPNSCCYTFKEIYYSNSPFIGGGPRATSLGIDTVSNCYYIVSASKWKLLNCGSSGGQGSTEGADGLTILGDGSPGNLFRVDTTLLATKEYVDQKFSEVSTGTVGPQGPQGEIGPTGPQGDQGLQGEAGLQGVKGDKGDQGDGIMLLGSVDDPSELPSSANSGDAYLINGDLWVWNELQSTFINGGNIQGPQGDQGLQGDTGPIGPVGPQGDQGLQGNIGPIGPVGPQGDQGLQGDTGPTGPVGPQGDQGLQGDTGPIGPVGPQGNPGLQGDTGPVGPVGSQGDQGLQGADGINCWDTNGNGQNDIEEDLNSDGLYNSFDCLPDISGLDDVTEDGSPPTGTPGPGEPRLHLDTNNGTIWVYHPTLGWKNTGGVDHNGIYYSGNNGNLMAVSSVKINKATTISLQGNSWQFDDNDFKCYINGAANKLEVFGSNAQVVFSPLGQSGTAGEYWRNFGGGSGRWQKIQSNEIKLTTAFLGMPGDSTKTLADALVAIADSIGKADNQTVIGTGRNNDPYRIDTTLLATKDYVDQNVCKYELTFGTENDGAFITATKPNVTFSRTDNEVLIVEPPGTKICSLTVRGSPSNHPSNESLYVKIDYQGKSYNQSYLNYKGVDWEVWDIGNFDPGDTIGSQWKSTDDSPPSPLKAITKVQNGMVITKTSNLGNYANYMIDFTKI